MLTLLLLASATEDSFNLGGSSSLGSDNEDIEDEWDIAVT